jgi:hypothetical protein
VILNAYAVLDAFVIFLRLVIALLVVGFGLSAWRRRRSSITSEDMSLQENRTYLLFLLAFLLLGLNLASWPLLYLLLQSYVSQWPGVMCIYGVSKVGAGSEGISRFLPGLLTSLQLTKPALVFASGAWFVLYLANRRTRTAPLLNRILCVLIAVGFLAGADSVVEAAYLAIPKKEEWLSTGCCSAALESVPNGETEPVLGAGDRPGLFAAYYAVNIGLVLALAGYVHRGRSHQKVPGLAFLAAGAVLALPVSAVFLREAAAPILLHLPYHHCPYDLIPDVPEAILAIGLFMAGTFSVGWAFVAARWANCPETDPYLEGILQNILFLGFWCYLGSLVMMTVELALA